MLLFALLSFLALARGFISPPPPGTSITHKRVGRCRAVVDPSISNSLVQVASDTQAVFTPQLDVGALVRQDVCMYVCMHLYTS